MIHCKKYHWRGSESALSVERDPKNYTTVLLQCPHCSTTLITETGDDESMMTNEYLSQDAERVR